MEKKKLIALGLDEAMADSCLKLFSEEVEQYKEDFVALEEQYKEEIKNLKIDNAIELLFIQFRGKNLKAIKALLDLEKVTVNEVGEVVGLVEQFESLSKDKNTSFLFNEEKAEKGFKGVSPISMDYKGNTITKKEFENMSYKEQLELYNKNKALYNELSK